MATGPTNPEREEEDYKSKPSAEDEDTAPVAPIAGLGGVAVLPLTPSAKPLIQPPWRPLSLSLSAQFFIRGSFRRIAMAIGPTNPEREEEDYGSKPSAVDGYTALVAPIVGLREVAVKIVKENKDDFIYWDDWEPHREALSYAPVVPPLYTCEIVEFIRRGVRNLNQLKCKYAAAFGAMDPLEYKAAGVGFVTMDLLKYKDTDEVWQVLRGTKESPKIRAYGPGLPTIVGQEHCGFDVSCVLYPVVVSYGEPKKVTSGSGFAPVPKFGDKDVPDEILQEICSLLPVDLIAHLQTINSAWHKALEARVAPERLRMMEPAQLAAHRLVVHQQRDLARLVADLMQEDETFYSAVGRLTFESNVSIVPFCYAGEVLGRLRNNPTFGRERRAYYVRLYKNPVWRV